MSVIKKKQISTEQIISNTTERMSSDVARLEQQRDTALNIFRGTINKIDNVNTELEQSVARFNSLIDFATHKRAEAQKQLDENMKIRQKIVEIIGE